MKRLVCALFVVALLGSWAGYAVEPSYLGPLGNPEEPALRPYKWMWHGLMGFQHQIRQSLRIGNMKTPALGSVEVFRGFRRGTVEVGESAYRGAVGAPVPSTTQYKEIGKANEAIDAEPLYKNTADLVASRWFFPALKANDLFPVHDEEQVAVMDAEAKRIHAERTARQRAADKEKNLPTVKRAQRRYVPVRAAAGAKRYEKGEGNLLKLAD